MSIFSELKRRNVFKVAAVYVVVAWILLQVSDTLAPALHLPEWFHSGVAFLLILGFPIAVVLAWAYEMTPEGLKKDRNVDHSHPVARKTKDTFFYTIIGILVIVLGAVTFWPPGDPETTVPQPAGEQFESGAPTIAVLSFANASNDPDQDYFSSGLTDDIITELSKYTELAVISRASTLVYDDLSPNVSAIGSKLNARYVLQGSVRKAGNSIRLTVQLSDAFKDLLIWGNNYQRDLTVSDLFSLQDELTQQVVSALTGSYGVLARSELAEGRRKQPANLDSYDCVLRAYDYLHSHDQPHHLKARDCLEGVVELDPEYADGWAWLAYLYADEYHHRRNERPEEYDSRDRALEVAERAVNLDPANQVSYGALAISALLIGDQERGKVAAYKAIEINPNNALWLGLLGTWVACTGDFDHSTPWAEKALYLNPNPPPWLHMPLFLKYYHEGQYEAALAEARLIETADFRTPAFLAAVNGRLGRDLEAKRALSQLRMLFQGSLDELNQELVLRNGFAPELADDIVEGVRQAANG